MHIRFKAAAAATALLAVQASGQQGSSASSVSAYTAPAQFPSSIFSSYYIKPAPTVEPQPAIRDPITGYLYPLNLTSGTSIPDYDPDPQPLPPPIGFIPEAAAQAFADRAITQISEIVTNGGITGNCSICVASLNVIQSLALVAPSKTPDALVTLCNKFKLHDAATCNETFRGDTLGNVWTQLLQKADVSGLDGRYICNSISSSSCSRPPAYPVIKASFPKPKPANAKAPARSGKTAKVLQLTDFHLDPRYEYGSEANCSSGLCCRTNVKNNAAQAGQVVLPASLYGDFACDSPYWLSVAALQAIHPLTETTGANDSCPLAFTIYTGDLASHDPASQLSRLYQDYTDTSVFGMFHDFLRGPVFATLGNHDTVPVAVDDPGLLPGQFSWNYDHVSALWLKEGWLDPATAREAATHYGGYSVKTPLPGLKVISLNTDFWYRANILNFYNSSNPDVSGMQRWLINELQAAEDKGDKVFIIGHVLTGWDGSNPLPNPVELFYQIVERYSPHVIRQVFVGHQHEDFSYVYYANNGTNRNDPVLGLQDALMTGWVGPSVTPLTNLNSGFRAFEIDTGSFDVMDVKTYYSDVNEYHHLDVTKQGPVFKFEYSTRQAYGQAAGWPADAPLNATFWHKVSQAIETQARASANSTTPSVPLAQLFNSYQGKSSVKSPVCNTVGCALAKVCYIRSGSAALGRQCPQGFASVQSAFTGTG